MPSVGSKVRYRNASCASRNTQRVSRVQINSRTNTIVHKFSSSVSALITHHVFITQGAYHTDAVRDLNTEWSMYAIKNMLCIRQSDTLEDVTSIDCPTTECQRHTVCESDTLGSLGDVPTKAEELKQRAHPESNECDNYEHDDECIARSRSISLPLNLNSSRRDNTDTIRDAQNHDNCKVSLK